MILLSAFLISLIQIQNIILAKEFKEITKIHLSNDRTVNELQFKAFGRNRRYTLQPAFIFKPGFRTWSTDGKSLKPIENLNIRSDSFYSVNGGKGSIHVEHDNDNILVHGIIDDSFTIAPHPAGKNHHVIKRTKDLRISQHTDNIRPSISKIETIKIPKHVRRQIRAIPIDYVKPNMTKPGNIKHNNHVKTRQASSVPDEVTIEILLAFDYANSQSLNFDHDSIVRYLGIFWNSVNLRYSDASAPKISIAISGLVTFDSEKAEPFITNNIVSGDQADANKVLYDFKSWLNGQSDLPNHDVAMLQTSVNGGSLSSGSWSDTITGLTFIGTACNIRGYNSGFFEDKAPAFTGVLTAAHELAHSLNVPHDGEEDAASCPVSDGYIMGAHAFNENSWHFSSCSLKIMKSYIRSNAGQCMWNKPDSDPEVPLLNEWPSVVAGSLDEQCKIRTGDDKSQFFGSINEDICSKLWCGIKDSNRATTNAGAIDGTPCNIQKICISGVCSPNDVPNLDEQCQNTVGDDYYAANKGDANVCTDLECTNSDSTKSISAEEGSLCGNAGVCTSGQCLYQIISLDDQCKRNFGDTYEAYIKDEINVCSILWCTQDQLRLQSKGGADENSSCGSDKICRNEICVAK